jgi:hypothetical protein
MEFVKNVHRDHKLAPILFPFAELYTYLILNLQAPKIILSEKMFRYYHQFPNHQMIMSVLAAAKTVRKKCIPGKEFPNDIVVLCLGVSHQKIVC